MPLESEQADKLLLDIIKLDGKLLALQKANTLSGSKDSSIRLDEKLKLTHLISAATTDTHDESTDGVETPSHAEDEDDVSMGDSSESEADS